MAERDLLVRGVSMDSLASVGLLEVILAEGLAPQVVEG